MKGWIIALLVSVLLVGALWAFGGSSNGGAGGGTGRDSGGGASGGGAGSGIIPNAGGQWREGSNRAAIANGSGSGGGAKRNTAEKQPDETEKIKPSLIRETRGNGSDDNGERNAATSNQSGGRASTDIRGEVGRRENSKRPDAPAVRDGEKGEGAARASGEWNRQKMEEYLKSHNLTDRRIDRQTAGRLLRNLTSTAGLREEEKARIAEISERKNLTARQVETLGRWTAQEPDLECANQTSQKERVACRLNLPKAEQKEGLYYLPEECRNFTEDGRASCLEKYDKIQPCRFMQGDEARFSCVKEKLNITRGAKEEVEECKKMVRSNNADAANGTVGDAPSATPNPGIGSCVSAVREKAFDEAKFKVYNLEEKAERLLQYGVSNQTVTNFVVRAEQLKADFNVAATVQAKKAVLKEVEAGWKAFLEQAKSEANRHPKREKNERTGNGSDIADASG